MKARKGFKRTPRCKPAGATGLVNADLLQRTIAWVVRDDIFANIAVHGNATWVASQLVTLAILWVWSASSQLTGAFLEAKQLSSAMFGCVALSSYQGLVKALSRYTEQLRPLLWERLHQLMESSGQSHWRIGGWLPLAIDGSRVSAPRTKSNEGAFAAPRYGQSAKARSRARWKNKHRRSKPISHPVKPQIWLTLLWHMGLKLPWSWRCGPSTSSERNHLLEMLEQQQLPEKTLICGDAGFVGYELWQGILKAEHSFVIRVGSNVRLLRELGFARRGLDLVHLWPEKMARKKQPPIVLRLLEIQSARGSVFLVTNILSERELSLSQASQLYRLRWGVELQFRTLKQTFGRGTLRSRTAAAALVELEWSLFGLWMVQLFAVKEQIAIDSTPDRCSVGIAIAVIRHAMRAWNQGASSAGQLTCELRRAVKDSYRRKSSKQARYRPDSKDKPSAGPPIIMKATNRQRAAFENMQNIAT